MFSSIFVDKKKFDCDEIHISVKYVLLIIKKNEINGLFARNNILYSAVFK